MNKGLNKWKQKQMSINNEQYKHVIANGIGNYYEKIQKTYIKTINLFLRNKN